MIHAFVFTLGLVHVAFLIAIAIRLRHLGFGGGTILRLIGFSLGIWPLILLLGIVTGLPVFMAWAGLPPVIAITLIVYVVMECMVLTEPPAAKDKRLEACRTEAARHEAQVALHEASLAKLVHVKSYVGEDNHLNAISDLGKLKAHGIPCQIEGAVVKALFVAEADVERVEAIIDIDKGESEQRS